MYEIAHQIALLPIAAVLLRGWSRVPESHRWMAAAFAVSWVWDSVIGWAGGGWETAFLFLPLQIGLAIAAFRPEWLLEALVVLYGLSLAGMWVGPPDIAVSVLGSGAVLWLAFRTRALRWTTGLYFGVGTLAYLAMIAVPEDAFMRAWYGYQGARGAAFGVFIAGLYTQRPG